MLYFGWETKKTIQVKFSLTFYLLTDLYSNLSQKYMNDSFYFPNKIYKNKTQS